MNRADVGGDRGGNTRCGGRLPVWTRIAVWAGGVAGRLSRRLGLGEGAVLGGRVTLALDRHALGRLAAGRRVVLVTGSNGKTTTAHLLAAALRTAGSVAHNDTGANMADGVMAALIAARKAGLAVLEVDELHLATVAEQVRPDLTTVPGRHRAVGEMVTDCTTPGIATLTGFEIHPGHTTLGPGATPLGRVASGVGNGDGTDGLLTETVVGTYLYGPVLARNPDLADLLLRRATGVTLPLIHAPGQEEARRLHLGKLAPSPEPGSSAPRSDHRAERVHGRLTACRRELAVPRRVRFPYRSGPSSVTTTRTGERPGLSPAVGAESSAIRARG